MHVTDLAELPLPHDVLALCERGRAAGVTIWVVGGTVRDAALGLPLRDVDLASALLPGRVAALLPHGVVADLDPLLGTCTFPIDDCGVTRSVQHTTFRVEGQYGADRRPREVAFVADLDRDAPRRDFTVNALYLDPLARSIVDPSGGRADLARRRFRTIGEPVRRLVEDPLRILRAIRLEARTGLLPCPATTAALAQCAPLAGQLVPQRRFHEIDDLLDGRWAADGVRRLLDTAVLAWAVPWLATRFASVRRTLDSGSFLADHVARWLALAGGDHDVAMEVLAGLEAPRPLRRAVAAPRGRALVSGRDLVALGVEPGPGLGDLLREALRRIAARGVVERDAALAIVAKLVGERIKPDPDESR
ncbi:MAG: CCA tRNA nucleotidyltransferase [Planctomycetes bacterium]|nr:CCA tRNA nucleotidyltransferase [Planctomycetota bacterium]